MKYFKPLVFCLAILAVSMASARANWLVKVTVSCGDVEESNGKEQLKKDKIVKEALIQRGLDAVESSLTVDDVELTYDSDSRSLHIIRKCNENEVVCTLATVVHCRTATNTDGDKTKAKSVCILQFQPEFGTTFGGAIGVEQVSVKGTDEKFKALFVGAFSLDEKECFIKWTTGKGFVESGPCPK